MRKPKEPHRFYKSTQWQVAREIKIRVANGKCERCGGLGQEVHHIVRLNVNTVNVTSISLNQDNLELLCKECHNKKHKRFSKETVFDQEGNLISR